MPPSNVAGRIRQFNQGRRPDLVPLKFAKLRKTPFAFFRGTAHLFYQYAPLPARLASTPLTGITGDLHLENFGVYRGDNGLACFSVNDFDEALLGPVAWDLARFVASLFVGLASLRRPSAEAQALAQVFLDAYARGLAAEGARLPDAALVAGPIGAIIRAFPSQAVPDFLDDGADLAASGSQLSLDNKHFLAIDAAERAQVVRHVGDFVRQNPSAGPLRVLDVARLLAGTSSLGLDRYAVLVAGEGPVGPSALLELKEVCASCTGSYLNCQQLSWPSEAARVVAAERQFQDVPPARLGWVGDAAKSFVVRDRARTRNRLSLDDPGLSERALATTVHSMAQVTAAGHLRGSTAEGGSGAAALRVFAQDPAWQAELIEFARAGAARSQADYSDYCAAFDRGDLSPY